MPRTGALIVKPAVRVAACLWLLGWAAFGLPWKGVRSRPALGRVLWVPFEQTRPADAARNLVYYVPMGAIGIALGWRAREVAGAGFVLSATTELAQLFSRAERFPSTTDVALNTAGTLVGIALAAAAKRVLRHRAANQSGRAHAASESARRLRPRS